MLSKNQVYLENGGWSSHLFFSKAKILIKELEKDDYLVDIGRTVAHIIKGKNKIKLYVHHNGKSKEYLTITDSKGNELKTFHYTDDVNDILIFIKSSLQL